MKCNNMAFNCLLVKTSLEIVDGPSGSFNPSQGVGSFQDGPVLAGHQFRESVSVKLINTGLDIDGDKVQHSERPYRYSNRHLQPS